MFQQAISPDRHSHNTDFMVIAADRCKSIFRRTERELLRLSSGDKADAVHGFRTSTRRLQTLLEKLANSGGGKHKKLVKMLNRIRRSAGKVRDVDVQLQALRSFKVPQEPRRKTQLIQALLELRAQHEKKLRKLLKKDDIREIRKRMKRAAGSLQFDSGPDPLAVARQMLSTVDLSNVADEKTLHHYRIMVKRARYAAEFAQKSADSAKFLADLKKLQDALGNWHDWLTLTHTAVERLGTVNESSLVAALYNVTRGKFRVAVAAVSASKSQLISKQEIATVQRPKKKQVAEQRKSAAAA
ncbi:MAG TPA: CHAD domain-containing protein [Dongiaceae bacterium]|nr:CHAD domain-containing protein [Dongiaceae bacterium]